MSNVIYTIDHFAKILHAKSFISNPELKITRLVIDSRRVIDPDELLVFCLECVSAMVMNTWKTLTQMVIRSFVISDAKYAAHLSRCQYFAG
jgi:hypothetical protein